MGGLSFILVKQQDNIAKKTTPVDEQMLQRCAQMLQKNVVLVHGCAGIRRGRLTELGAETIIEIVKTVETGEIGRLSNGHAPLPQKTGGMLQAYRTDQSRGRLPGQGLRPSVQL